MLPLSRRPHHTRYLHCRKRPEVEVFPLCISLLDLIQIHYHSQFSSIERIGIKWNGSGLAFQVRVHSIHQKKNCSIPRNVRHQTFERKFSNLFCSALSDSSSSDNNQTPQYRLQCPPSSHSRNSTCTVTETLRYMSPAASCSSERTCFSRTTAANISATWSSLFPSAQLIFYLSFHITNRTRMCSSVH